MLTLRAYRYAPACTKMLAQSKTILNLITSEQGTELPGSPPPIANVQDFMKFFKVSRAAEQPIACHSSPLMCSLRRWIILPLRIACQ
jgi:hypothetical protein